MPPDCAEPVIGRRFAPTRWLHPGYAPEYEGGEPPPLPLHVLLLRSRRGLGALGAGDADLIAVGDAVGRRDDDAVVRRDTGRQFDILAEVAGDGDGLEQHLVVSADGRDPQTALVENESAGGDV